MSEAPFRLSDCSDRELVVVSIPFQASRVLAVTPEKYGPLDSDTPTILAIVIHDPSRSLRPGDTLTKNYNSTVLNQKSAEHDLVVTTLGVLLKTRVL
jgi:hypothetical protein